MILSESCKQWFNDFFIAPPPCLGHSAGRAWMSSLFGRLDPIGRHTLPLSPKSRSEERGFNRDHQRHHQRRSSTIIYCLSPPLARGSIFPGAARNIPSWQPLKIWSRFGWQFLNLVAIVWSQSILWNHSDSKPHHAPLEMDRSPVDFRITINNDDSSCSVHLSTDRRWKFSFFATFADIAWLYIAVILVKVLAIRCFCPFYIFIYVSRTRAQPGHLPPGRHWYFSSSHWAASQALHCRSLGWQGEQEQGSTRGAAGAP